MLYIVIIFLILHLFFAINKQDKPDDFFLAGKKQGIFGITFSLSATIIGSSAVLGTVRLGYHYGPAGALWLLAGSAGLLILYFTVKFLPENAFTLPQLAGIRSGKTVEIVSSLLMIPAWTAISAAQFKAAALLMMRLGNFSLFTALILTGIFMGIYVFRGGQHSVFLSDKIQFSLILIGISAALFLILNSGNSPSPHINTENWFGKYGVIAMFPVMISYITGPDIHSRLLSADSLKTRKKSLLISAFIIAFAGISLAFVGMYAASIGIPASSDSLLFTLLDTLPAYLSVPFYLAVLSALISSADTCLFTVSSVTAVDLLGKGVKTARFFVFFFVVLAVVTAYKGGGIIPLMMFAYKIFSGVLGGYIFMALFTKIKPEEPFITLGILFSAALFATLEFSSVRYSSLYCFAFSIFWYAISTYKSKFFTSFFKS